MPADPFSLAGKSALVTGGGTGLGFGISRAFCQAGARVIVTGRRADVLKQACAELGENASYRTADLSRLETIPDLISGIECEGIALDILVNNAGINMKKPALEVTDAEFETIIATNLTGLFALTP